MKLHLPTRLRAAVLACITAVAALSTTIGTGVVTVGSVTYVMAASQAQAIEYSGTIYTYTGSGNVSAGPFVQTNYDSGSDTFSLTETATTGWNGGALSVNSVIGDVDANAVHHTVRFTAGSGREVTLDFAPLTVAGFIVDEGATGYSITYGGGNRDRRVDIGNSDAAHTAAYSSIKENFTLNVSASTSTSTIITLKGTQTWDIATGKTMTLAAPSATTVRVLASSAVSIIGGGTMNVTNSLTLNLAGLTTGAQPLITVAEGTTLQYGSLALDGYSDLAAGEYSLVSTTATQATAMATALGMTSGRAQVTADGGILKLTVLESLVWNGGSGTWDDSAENWLSGETAAPFSPDASVIFDTADAQVTISGDKQTSIVQINANTAWTGTATVSTQTLTGTGTLSLDSGVTLSVGESATGVTLSGSGTYAVTSASLGSNVSLDANWTGTVRLTGATGNKSLGWAVANGSVVELNGVTGWAVWNGNNPENIKLTDNGETAAWTNGAYSSNAANVVTYSGAWSGEGTYVVDIADGGARYMDHKFSGDISAWTGELKVQANNEGSRANMTFMGNATTVNATLTKVSGHMNVIADADTTFNGDITADSLTVNADKTVVINGSANNFAGVITNNGTLTLNNTTINATMVNTGTLNIGSGLVLGADDYSLFELNSAGSSTWSDVERSQGFSVMTGASYFAVKGGTVAGDLAAAGLSAVEGGYVFSVANSSSTVYVVNATTATLTSADTEHATSYNIVNDAAEVTVESGTFDFSKVVADTRTHLSSLVLTGGDATISGGSKIFSGDVVINDGSTLTIGTVDSFVYSQAELSAPAHLITVNEGGTLAFGDKRLSIGNEGHGDTPNVYQLVVNGGSVTGAGEGANGALDYFGDGTIEATGTTGVISANVRVRGGKTLTVDVKEAADSLTMSGLINSNGTANLIKAGEGTLVLSHKNTYGGSTTVNAGTLKLATGGQEGAIKGTLNINEGGKVDLAAGDATGWGTTNHVDVLNVTGGELHVSVGGGAGTNQTFANTTINLTGGSLTGVENSNIDLYGGSSTVHAKAAEGATAEAPTVSTVSGVTLSLREASTTFTVDENAKLVLNTGLKNGNKSETFDNALVVEGAGTLVLNAAGTYQGGTTINGGSVVVGQASALGTGAVTMTAGALTLCAENAITSLSVGSGASLDMTAATSLGGALTLADGSTLVTSTADSAMGVTGLNITSGMTLSIAEAAEGYTDAIKLFSGLTTDDITGLTFAEEAGAMVADITGIITVSGVASDYSRVVLKDGTLSLVSTAAPSADLTWLGGDGTWGDASTPWTAESGASAYIAGADVTIGGEGTTGGTITVSGAQTAASLTIAGSDYIIQRAATGENSLTITGDLTVKEGVSFSSTFLPTVGSIVLEEGSELFFNNSSYVGLNGNLRTILGKVTEESTGTLKMSGGPNFDNNVSNRVDLNSADISISHVSVEITENVAFNAWNRAAGANVNVESSLTVANELRMESNTSLNIANGGSVTVGTLGLGHTQSGNPGRLVMEEGSSLTTGSIASNAGGTTAKPNGMDVNGGTLTITGASAFSGTGELEVTVDNATIKTGAENNTTWNHKSSLTNVTLAAAKGHSITVGAAGIETTLAGTLTNTGTATLAGMLDTTALTGVTNSGTLTVNAASVSLAGLNNTGSVVVKNGEDAKGSIVLTAATTAGGNLSAANVTLTGVNTFGTLTLTGAVTLDTASYTSVGLTAAGVTGNSLALVVDQATIVSAIGASTNALTLANVTGLTSATINGGTSFKDGSREYTISVTEGLVQITATITNEVVWEGTEGEVWGDGAAWDDEKEPTADSNVVFKDKGISEVKIGEEVSVNSIIVESDKSFLTNSTSSTVEAHSLEIDNGTLTIDENVAVVISGKDTAKGNTGVSGDGNIIIKGSLETDVLAAASKDVQLSGSLTIKDSALIDSIGGITEGQDTAYGDLIVGALLAPTTADEPVAGKVTLAEDSTVQNLTVTSTGDLTAEKKLTVLGDMLNVGKTTVKGDLTQGTEDTTTDTLTNSGTLNVTGTLTSENLVTESGSTLQAANLAADTLSTEGDITVAATTTVSGDLTATGGVLSTNKLTMNGESATLDVSGTGTKVTVLGTATVAVDSVSVTDGGLFSSQSGDITADTITVLDAGSTLSANNKNATITADSVSVTNGGAIQSDAGAALTSSIKTASLTIDGADSVVKIKAVDAKTAGSTTTVEVTNGGALAATNTVKATNVTVTGANSSLTAGGSNTVTGVDATTLKVQEGASFSATSAKATNATVDGTGTTATIGYGGLTTEETLTVTNGATLQGAVGDGNEGGEINAKTLVVGSGSSVKTTSTTVDPGNITVEKLEVASTGSVAAAGTLKVTDEILGTAGSITADTLDLSGLTEAAKIAALKANTITLSDFNMLTVTDSIGNVAGTGAAEVSLTLSADTLNNLSTGDEMVVVTLDNSVTGQGITMSTASLAAINAALKAHGMKGEMETKEGKYVMVIKDNSFLSQLGSSENGLAGLALADAAADAGVDTHGDLSAILQHLDELRAAGTDEAAAAGDKIGAALSGASVAAMGAALSGDVERQLKAIRNRTTVMGVNQAVVNEEMPYLNAWVNAEGDYRDISADGTMPGYKMTSWGGTVGFDVDCTPSFTCGLAATAMYGDFTSTGEDHGEGELNTYYVSAFGRYAKHRWTHTFVATAGMADTSLDRTVDGVKVTGDSEGTMFGGMYEVGYVFALDKEATTCLQPIVNVSYTHATLSGYDESGSDVALKTGDVEMNKLTVGVGARLQSVIGENIYNRSSLFEARALVKFDAGDRQGEVTNSFVKYAGSADAKSVETGAIGGEFGMGVTIPVGMEGGNIFMDASAEIRADYVNVNGTVGYRVNF